MEQRERRKEIRINKQNSFQFKIAENVGRIDLTTPLTLQGKLIDYSAAGIRFITDAQLDKNSSLVIRLDLDSFNNDQIDWRELWETGNDTYLNVIGSVMWCLTCDQESDKYEVGTRFTQKALES